MLQKSLILSLLLLFSAACDTEHRGHTIAEFSGDFRFDGDIGEFFDCAEGAKYFIAQSGAYQSLKEKYVLLGLKNKDDVYITVEGYLKKENLMEGLDPITVFVVVKLISMDIERGCKRGDRMGG